MSRRLNRHGTTALIDAIIEKDIELARYLIERGDDVNIQIKDGSNALYEASSRGHTELVKLLLVHGANPNLLLSGAHTALIECSQHTNNVKIVQLLLEYGADPNVQWHSGYTALCLTSNVEIAKLLIQYKADLHHPRVLNTHRYEYDIDVVKFLLESGAKYTLYPAHYSSGLKRVYDQHSFNSIQSHLPLPQDINNLIYKFL